MNFTVPEKTTAKCECGAEACGSPAHSQWCPKSSKAETCNHASWIFIDGGTKQCLKCAKLLEDSDD